MTGQPETAGLTGLPLWPCPGPDFDSSTSSGGRARGLASRGVADPELSKSKSDPVLIAVTFLGSLAWSFVFVALPSRSSG